MAKRIHDNIITESLENLGKNNAIRQIYQFLAK